jgi:hypothetical protein
LLDFSKKDFNLPTAFVNLGNGAGCPLRLIGNEFNLLLVYFIPNDYTPEWFRILFFRCFVFELDNLVKIDADAAFRAGLTPVPH